MADIKVCDICGSNLDRPSCLFPAYKLTSYYLTGFGENLHTHKLDICGDCMKKIIYIIKTEKEKKNDR